jgi:hypothetical protein
MKMKKVLENQGLFLAEKERFKNSSVRWGVGVILHSIYAHALA